MDDAAEVEKLLSNRAFVPGRSSSATTASSLAVISQNIQGKIGAPSDSEKLDTAANRRSVMARSRLDAYKREFGHKTHIKSSTKRRLREIGGSVKGIGKAFIPDPPLPLLAWASTSCWLYPTKKSLPFCKIATR